MGYILQIVVYYHAQFFYEKFCHHPIREVNVDRYSNMLVFCHKHQMRESLISIGWISGLRVPDAFRESDFNNHCSKVRTTELW